MPVSRLGIAEQQLVEIAKTLSSDARILVMDEPTSALADNEIRRLFAIIRTLKRKGVSIIYISRWENRGGLRCTGTGLPWQGCDAVADARAAILEGAMAASVAQHPFEIGRLAVENAHRVVKGESIPADIPVTVELIPKNTRRQP